MSDKILVKIIGMGRFGTFLHEVITEKLAAEVILTEEIEEADVVIPCVPISAFEKVIKDISNMLKANSIVMDVCSVKTIPVEIMVKYLPKSVDIISTHPMFGPDSAKNGLADLRIVAYPVRVSAERFQILRTICESLKLRFIEMTPEEHDKIAAYTQAYVHLIGRIGQKIQIKASEIDTMGFQKLFEAQQLVTNDTDQLFKDMNNFNPFTKEMRGKVQKALLDIEKDILDN